MNKYHLAEDQYHLYHGRVMEALKSLSDEELRKLPRTCDGQCTGNLPKEIAHDMSRALYAGMDAPMPEHISHIAPRLITLGCYASATYHTTSYIDRYAVAVKTGLELYLDRGRYSLWCDVLDAYFDFFLYEDEYSEYQANFLKSAATRWPTATRDPRYGCGRLLLNFAQIAAEKKRGERPDYNWDTIKDAANRITELDIAFGPAKKQIDIELMDLLRLILMLWI